MDEARIGELKSRLAGVVAEHFQVQELLGAGGFAAVFRARDIVLQRDVAIKVLDPALALDRDVADRALDEARLVASIEHPHIVPLYEAGIQDGIVFLVMRYYPDGTAGARLARAGPYEPAALAALGAEVADALAAAHGRGIVHLDIKPDNILLDPHGHAAVSDFGIARALADAATAAPGLVSGTPHYMSPEQVAGDRVDGRTDVYALGVVLYELAAGQRPIEGNSARQVMANQVRAIPRPISDLVGDMPGQLAGVIGRALEKDPDKRWASAREMAEALRVAASPENLITPVAARRRGRRRWYRRGAMLGCGVLAGILVIGWAVLWVLKAFRSGEPPAMDALRPLVPPILIDSAVSMGALTSSDTVLYLFIPHGRGMRDAFMLTTRDIVVVNDGVSRRYPISQDYDIDIKRTPREGFLIIKHPDRQTLDTVYRQMTGVEQQVLGLSLRRAFGMLR